MGDGVVVQEKRDIGGERNGLKLKSVLLKLFEGARDVDYVIYSNQALCYITSTTSPYV